MTLCLPDSARHTSESGPRGLDSNLDRALLDLDLDSLRDAYGLVVFMEMRSDSSSAVARTPVWDTGLFDAAITRVDEDLVDRLRDCHLSLRKAMVVAETLDRPLLRVGVGTPWVAAAFASARERFAQATLPWLWTPIERSA